MSPPSPPQKMRDFIGSCNGHSHAMFPGSGVVFVRRRRRDEAAQAWEYLRSRTPREVTEHLDLRLYDISHLVFSLAQRHRLTGAAPVPSAAAAEELLDASAFSFEPGLACADYHANPPKSAVASFGGGGGGGADGVVDWPNETCSLARAK